MSVGTGSAHMDRNQHALGLALRIEVRRLLTTRTWWALGAMAVAVGGVITALTVAGSDESALPALDVFTGALTGGVQTSYLLTAIVGISAVHPDSVEFTILVWCKAEHFILFAGGVRKAVLEDLRHSPFTAPPAIGQALKNALR